MPTFRCNHSETSPNEVLGENERLSQISYEAFPPIFSGGTHKYQGEKGDQAMISFVIKNQGRRRHIESLHMKARLAGAPCQQTY